MSMSLATMWLEVPQNLVSGNALALILQDADMVLSNSFIVGFFLVILLSLGAGAAICWMIIKPGREKPEVDSPADWQFDHAPVALWEEDWSEVLIALPEGWLLRGTDPEQRTQTESAVATAFGKLRVRSVNLAALRVLNCTDSKLLEELLAATYSGFELNHQRQLIRDLTNEPNASSQSFMVELKSKGKITLNVRWVATPGSENSMASVMAAAEPVETP